MGVYDGECVAVVVDGPVTISLPSAGVIEKGRHVRI